MTQEILEKLTPIVEVIQNYIKVLEASNEELQKKLEAALKENQILKASIPKDTVNSWPKFDHTIPIGPSTGGSWTSPGLGTLIGTDKVVSSDDMAAYIQRSRKLLDDYNNKNQNQPQMP